MKFLLMFAQLETTAVHVNKHKAKCSLLIARHLLLFCAPNELLIFILKWKNLGLCSSAEAGIVLKF